MLVCFQVNKAFELKYIVILDNREDGGAGSRGRRELALVRMVCTTDHTISHV